MSNFGTKKYIRTSDKFYRYTYVYWPSTEWPIDFASIDQAKFWKDNKVTLIEYVYSGYKVIDNELIICFRAPNTQQPLTTENKKVNVDFVVRTKRDFLPVYRKIERRLVVLNLDVSAADEFRAEVIDKIYELFSHNNQHQECLFTTINIADRFLAAIYPGRKITRSAYIEILSVCHKIAVLLQTNLIFKETMFNILIEEKRDCDYDELEQKILKAIDFNIFMPTVFTFTKNRLAFMTLLDGRSSHFYPSEIASCCDCISLEQKSRGVNKECLYYLDDLCKNNKNTFMYKHCNIESYKFKSVSNIPLSRSPSLYLTPSPTKEYEVVTKAGEGVYGNVYYVQNEQGTVYAMKSLPLEQGRLDEIIIREVSALKLLGIFNQPNIISIHQVSFASNKANIIMDACPIDLSKYIKDHCIHFTTLQWIMKGILEGLYLMHSVGLLHLDMKPPNIILDTEKKEVKIIDFSLVESVVHNRDYVNEVVTLCYRPPELLLSIYRNTGRYNYVSEKTDMWSVGCILGELFNYGTLFPLGEKQTSFEQVLSILKILGNNIDDFFPSFPGKLNEIVDRQTQTMLDLKYTHEQIEAVFDLMNKLLCIDPNRRLSAEEALQHKLFKIE